MLVAVNDHGVAVSAFGFAEQIKVQHFDGIQLSYY